VVEKSLERTKKTLPRKPLRIFHPNRTENLDAYFCIRKKRSSSECESQDEKDEGVKSLSCTCQTFSFAVSGGLCNLCLDKANKDYILEANGVEPVINCLSSSNEETVMSAVTTLMYLTTTQSRQQTTALPVVECMLRFSLSANRRLSNLATVFLEDYCTPLQVEEARNLSKHTAVGIPLPKD